MTRRLWRILAVAYAFGNTLAITSFIGLIPKAEPFNWGAAWLMIASLCVSALLGFLAGVEAAKDFE